MASFDSNGAAIHYEKQGRGAPVILVHGFASSIKGNWKDPGWIDFLSANYRVVAMDCRGHGHSANPYDPAAYGTENMAGDVIRLMDHLGIPRALLMGYSMGAWISLNVVLSYPGRIRAVVLGGIGDGRTMGDRGRREGIAQALLAERVEDVTDEAAKTFRVFAEANRNDLKALAACMTGERLPLDPATLGKIRMPALIVVGTKDVLVGGGEGLQTAIPGSQLVKLEGRDHLNAVGDKLYKEAVSRFFAAAPA